MSGRSYDPRMEKLPLLISYPRSGSNWLNCVMELYFERPRLRVGGPTFLKGPLTNFMWFHDHDITGDLTVGHDNIFYLYRDPVDVIFSLLMAEHKGYNDSLVEEQCSRIHNNYKKYLLLTGCPNIRLDVLKSNPSEFQKIIDWLTPGKLFDQEKFDRANQSVSLAKVIDKQKDKRYFNQKMMSDDYAKKRSSFRGEFGSKIYGSTIFRLEPFFQGLNV